MTRQPKKKKPNLARCGKFDTDEWRGRQIHIRTIKFFYDQSDQWALEHETDTDDQLIEYVRKIALELRRMPRPIEVPGGYYIEQRLGRWLSLAEEFGVKGYNPDNRYKETVTAVYRSEFKRQEELFREERHRKKEERATKRKMHRKPSTEPQRTEHSAEAVAGNAAADR